MLDKSALTEHNQELDEIDKIGDSLVQHGKSSDRVYLMKLHRNDALHIADKLKALAEEKGYSKIFAKIPEMYSEPFLAHGYEIEAHIPRFYDGRDSALFVGKFLTEERRSCEGEDIAGPIEAAIAKRETREYPLPEGFSMRPIETEDVEDAALVYREVFQTYPFPIHDPDYLLETMESHVIYFGVYQDDRLVALASAETDEEHQNAEMTDFATLPDYRGQGLAASLLHHMHKVMAEKDYKTLYTIARARSFGMNITFGRLGYIFSGTLKCNTQISGDLESMNVWYMHL
ncbi:MAG: putative beta-lysine N-acetyltransferase [Candidatus Sumerlaeia bacterium]